MLETLLQHPLTLRLGWTLTHSLWQGVVLSTVLGVALLILDYRRSQLRYALASLVLLVWLAAPIATFFVLAPTGAGTPEAMPSLGALLSSTIPASGDGGPKTSLTYSAVNDLRSVFVTSSRDQALEVLSGLLPYAAIVWLTIASLLSLRLLGGIIVVQLLARSSAPLTQLQSQLDTLATRLGVRRRVRLRASRMVDTPIALGLLKPMVLLPASATTGLTTSQLELILAHELAHIRRHDYLTNILQGVAEALLFYHPLTWWISHTLRAEREHVCDGLALRTTGSLPLELAEALAMLETSRPAPLPALGATSNLSRRIRRLLSRPQLTRARPGVLLPIVGTALLGLWLALAAQPSPASQAKPSVVIDPAHNELFPGVSGPIEEAELTLVVARKLKALLEQQGISARLTRDSMGSLATTYNEELRARAAVAKPDDDLFLTLHASNSPDTSHTGIRISVPAPTAGAVDGEKNYQAALDLARIVGQETSTRLGTRYGIDRPTPNVLQLPIPSLIVGLGFLSNSDEGAKLATDAYQQRLAGSLAEAVLTYLDDNGSSAADQDGGRSDYEAIITDQPASALVPPTPLVTPFSH